jgi:hypothetical protein
LSEPESVSVQILVRFFGGAGAIILGTGISYWLIIGNYLERLERYKEKLRVCRKLYGRSRNAIQGIEGFQGYPESIDQFSRSISKFNEYLNGENELFIPSILKEQCQAIIRAQELVVETVRPDEYLQSGNPVRYSEERLVSLINEFQLLNDMIKAETESIGFRVPKWFTEWYKGLVPRLPDWCRKVWACLRSGKDPTASGG